MFFFSHFDKNIDLHCDYSNTPGETIWYINNDLQSSNELIQITQTLLHIFPNVLYEDNMKISNVDPIVMADIIVMFSVITARRH